MKDKESGAAALLSVVLLLTLVVPSVMWRGYVLSIMWGWFISSTFNITPLTIPAALGIAGIFSFLRPEVSCKKDDDDNGYIHIVAKSIVESFGGPAHLAG